MRLIDFYAENPHDKPQEAAFCHSLSVNENAMLIEFRVKNFRSIKEEQTLSMVAGNDDSLPENTFALTPKKTQSPKLPIHKMRFLKSAVIYGANASGKSSLWGAMSLAFHFLSCDVPVEAVLESLAQPFLLDKDYRNAPTEFTIVFTIGDEDIRYDLHLAVTSERIIEETLEYYPKGRVSVLYTRRYDFDKKAYQYDFPGGNLKGDKNGLEGKTNKKTFFLTVAAAFNHPGLSRIVRWFGAINPSSLLMNGIADDCDKYLASRPNMATAFKEWLFAADLGIRGYQFDRGEAAAAIIEKQFMIRDPDGGLARTSLKHSVMKLSHIGNGEDSFIQWYDESGGTQRWIGLFYRMMQVIENSGVLFIDEMSTDLHPLLAEYFFATFNRMSPCAQLIGTTHHSSLLGAKILRRDQIWFAEKDEIGASHYYSLLEFKPRKDEAWMKNYLAGSYGAIPYIRGEENEK